MTTYEEIFNRFWKRIREDEDFFGYDETSKEAQMSLIIEKTFVYFQDAVDELKLNYSGDIDFGNKNDTLECFNFDLIDIEKKIIVELMIEMYLREDVIKLRTQEIIFDDKDIKVFSPAQERKTFMDMYNNIMAQNRSLIKKYKGKDRETGKIKRLDYSSFSN